MEWLISILIVIAIIFTILVLSIGLEQINIEYVYLNRFEKIMRIGIYIFLGILLLRIFSIFVMFVKEIVFG